MQGKLILMLNEKSLQSIKLSYTRMWADMFFDGYVNDNWYKFNANNEEKHIRYEQARIKTLGNSTSADI